MAKDMPCGDHTHWKLRENCNFERITDSRGKISSQEADEWLSYLEEREFHRKISRENKFGPRLFSVDGYLHHYGQGRGLILEYLGLVLLQAQSCLIIIPGAHFRCWWHSHGCSQSNGKINEQPRLTRAESAQQLDERKRYFEELGFSTKFVWSCEWNRQKAVDPAVAAWFTEYKRRRYLHYRKGEIECNTMKRMLMTGEIFGFVKCSLETPEELQEKLAEFPPIGKRTRLMDLN
jgi:hypothetical protein